LAHSRSGNSGGYSHSRGNRCYGDYTHWRGSRWRNNHWRRWCCSHCSGQRCPPLYCLLFGFLGLRQPSYRLLLLPLGLLFSSLGFQFGLLLAKFGLLCLALDRLLPLPGLVDETLLFPLLCKLGIAYLLALGFDRVPLILDDTEVGLHGLQFLAHLAGRVLDHGDKRGQIRSMLNVLVGTLGAHDI
jgi:hypothetical protein